MFLHYLSTYASNACVWFLIGFLAVLTTQPIASYAANTSSFSQTDSGIVSIEVENFHSKAIQGEHDWQAVNQSGNSGAGALQALPNQGSRYNNNYVTNSPRLDFQVNFVRTGVHYVWIRGLAGNNGDDSLHVGLNGAAVNSSDRISGFTSTWGWSNSTMDGSPAMFNVPTAGLYTVNVWMREDGMVIDKLVLATDPSYTPSGTGPAESPQSGLQAVATPVISPNGGTFENSVNITLSSETSGAILYYTWDGSNPTPNSTQYAGPFNLTESAVVKAAGFLGGYDDSNIASATFTIANSGNQAPVVSLSAAPSSVEYNGNSTLTWSSTNADTCTASGDWSGAKETSGTEAVGPLTADSTFTLSCSGAGGNISRSAAVNVGSQSGSNWLSESFDGYAVGDDPINWFDTARDNSMSHDEAMFKVFDVEGQKVSGTAQTATTNIHSHYIGADSESWTNYEYTGRMRISGAPDGVGVTFFSDYPNTDSYYRLRRQGSGAFHISPHGSGIECSGTTDTGVVPAANAWYLFKVQVEDTGSQTEVRARVWREGSSEPASWQASCSDTGTRRTSGTVGLWGVVSGQDSGTKHWDDLVTKSLTSPQSPTLTLTANPTTIDYNGSTTLIWSSTNADACTATDGWSGPKGTSGAETSGPLTAGNSFTLTCSGSGGEVIKSATVSVGAAPQSPTLTLTANPTTVDYNGSTTLTWSSTNADVCTASGGWSSPKGTSGAETSGPLTADSTFTLTCSGSGGEVIKSAAVSVGAVPQSPTLTLTANPTTADYNGSTTLSWSSTHADSCMASGDWSGPKNISGSETVGSLTIDSTFTLSCSGAGGNINRSTAVNVGPQSGLSWLSESFDGYAVDDDPINWFDTARDNSMSHDEAMFKVFDVAGQKVSGTAQTATTNIHSHYIGAGSESWTNYEYTGRMRISGARDGIGVTFFSDYPNTDSYYRLRRQGSVAFHISPHGSGIECSGTTDTGVVPAANSWYRFRIQVEDTGSQTEVRAKIWRNGTNEPSSWQASCADTGTRLLSGTVGLWGVVSGQDTGAKYWDDLVVNSIGSPQTPTLTLTATPTTVDAGGSATLTWSSTHADSCMGSGDWPGPKATSGSEITGPLTGDATYTLTCSGAGGSSSKTVAIAVGANNTPSIGGTPATSVDVNTIYSFIPNANDVDGDILTFSITNKPNWASFNANTGALTGTPTAADSGTTTDIVISVSDGTDTASLAAFNITVSVASFGNAALSWTPPTTNIDGTGLTDLAGYRIHYGTSIGTYPNTVNVNTPTITSFVVENLPSGNYFFVVTAYDTSGNESPFSNVASTNISIP